GVGSPGEWPSIPGSAGNSSAAGLGGTDGPLAGDPTAERTGVEGCLSPTIARTLGAGTLRITLRSTTRSRSSSTSQRETVPDGSKNPDLPGGRSLCPPRSRRPAPQPLVVQPN
ncbi:MAG TPA: hypothetical protein VNG12_17505, partial [Acidimicrobiales bacterium]|nr:hypothetical protein [Acidimicrobiales bacterium]